MIIIYFLLYKYSNHVYFFMNAAIVYFQSLYITQLTFLNYQSSDSVIILFFMIINLS